MKKLKVFLAIICIVVMMPATFAHADTGYGYDPKEVKKSADELILDLVKMTDEELEYYSENSMGWTSIAAKEMLTYRENSTLGAYINADDITLTEDGKKLLLIKRMHFEKCDLEATATMAKIGEAIRVTDIHFKTIDISDKSLGEKMANAAFNTVIGIVSVFIVLLLISFIISLFKYIPKLQAIFAKKEADTVEAVFEKAIAQIEEKQERGEDTELVAVITAAICASTGATSDSFVVRSIKRVDSRRKR